MCFPTMWYVQCDQSPCNSLEYSMSVKLLTEHNLEFLSLKGGYTCLSESTLDKMPLCWIKHVSAQILPLALDRVVLQKINKNC